MNNNTGKKGKHAEKSAETKQEPPSYVTDDNVKKSKGAIGGF